MPDDKPKERHEPATKWKLVEMRCEALTDAAKSARAPFLLALLWAFVWSASIYIGSAGYLRDYQARYEHEEKRFEGEFKSFGVSCAVLPDTYRKKLCSLTTSATPRNSVSPELADVCELIGHSFEGVKYQAQPGKVRDCAQEISNRVTRSIDRIQQQLMVTLPGFSVVLHYSDLGIVGAVGLILILAWLFFALRRENHAIGSFINVEKTPSSKGPSSIWRVIPQEKYWSAEHYAFAYSAVSQRFLFLFTAHSIALQSVAVFMAAFPLIVTAASFLTDIYTSYNIFFVMDDSAVKWRVLAELVLLIIVGATTSRVTRYILLSNRLLNAWYLATKHVWMDEWDERDETPASMVLIDDQSGKVWSDPIPSGGIGLQGGPVS